jgi:cell filamentation protein
MPLRYIGTGMADIHRRLREANFLCGLSRSAFADGAATIIGDINHVHPFREGNGRTQLQYLGQLASQAGHELDLTRLDAASWLHASKEANAGRYEAMARCIEETLRGG